jgi:hypothetical protein
LRIPISRSRLSALTIISALLIIGTACSEDEDPVTGFGLISTIVDSTQLRATVIGTSDLDTYFQTTRNSATRIWTGNQPEENGIVEAKALIRFGVNLPEAAVVIGDTLRLYCDLEGDYGNPALQIVEIELVTSDAWYTDTSVGWPFDDHQPLDPPTSFRVTSCEDSTNTLMEIPLPANLVQGWIAEPDSNFGLALVAGTGQGWKRFLADGVLEPTIGLRYVLDADTTDVRLPMNRHVTLYSLDPDGEAVNTGDEPFALIGVPYDFRTVVRFDLDFFQADVNLHEVRLELRLDPDAAWIGEDPPVVTIGAHAVVGLPSEILDPRPVIGFASTPVDQVEVNAVTDSTVSLNVSAIGPALRNGVLLRVEQDFPALVQVGIFTREAAAEIPPRLDVVFSYPARIRL